MVQLGNSNEGACKDWYAYHVIVLHVAGAAPQGVVYGVPVEGTVSPREQEAAQQMQRLHRGGADVAESPEADEPGPSAAATPPASAAAAARLRAPAGTGGGGGAGSPAEQLPRVQQTPEHQESDAEREEYEDEGLEREGLQ